MFMKASKNLPFRKVTYGKSKSADIKILESEAVYGQAPLSLPIGQYAVIDINGKKERIELTGVLGSHLMYPVAAASGVASILNIADDLPTVFSHLELSKGRMRLLSGKSKSIIIDDTYNSSPIASVEALRTLKGLSVRGRKIAALADMKELGDFSETAHMEIGKLAAECLHTLITVGSMSEAVSLGAIEAGMSSDRTRHFADSTVAAKAIDDIMRAGDVILVKGSQSMRMERIVSGLVEEGSNPKDLLVRQEVEWKNR
jgi:UDP-N-acetylmuramoyl-tripeptide--D-alanyl-D-alanine ligase